MMVRRRVSHVPANLITGFLGVGKSTAIRRLLEQAPAGEHWAVLVNEFGEVAVDGAAVAPDHGAATIRELPGGCLCCTMGTPLQVTLARLLRDARPDRLLIEPTGVGHPARVLDTLRSGGLAEALDVRATICLVDPRRLNDGRVLASAIFRDQAELADVLVANKVDLCTQPDIEQFHAWAEGLFPAKAQVATTRHGVLDPAWLDVPADPGRKAVFPQAHADEHHQARERSPDPEPGRPVRQRNQGQGLDACGWRFHPADSFDRDCLAGVIRALGAQVRVKGVFHCGRDWLLFDRAEGALSVRAASWRTDSRIECIAVAGEAPDWDAVEEQLRAAQVPE